jgi:hypothetical protein
MQTINKDLKLQNDYDAMYDLVVTKKLSNQEISNLLYISKKLVAIKIKEHGIVRR